MRITFSSIPSAVKFTACRLVTAKLFPLLHRSLEIPQTHHRMLHEDIIESNAVEFFPAANL